MVTAYGTYTWTQKTYAHIEIAAACLVVFVFGALVITRHHEGVKTCDEAKMIPLRDPNLPAPSSTFTFNSSSRPQLFSPSVVNVIRI